MAAVISEYFKFIALFFKSNYVMIFNGLIGLGTVVSQTAYNIFAFNCPCSPKKNYLYGLAFFVIGVMLNQNTWDIVSKCRTRKCHKFSMTAAFALLGSIVGRTVVAPITWTIIPGVWLCLHCWAGSCWAGFLLLCLKNCCSPLGHQQEAYWDQYRCNEQALFQPTAELHAKIHAAKSVKSFFGFVALENQEKELLADCQSAKSTIPCLEWNRITGVYMYRENNDTPLYSRLDKWAMYEKDNNCLAIDN